MMATATTRDVILAIALFLGPPAAGIVISILREIRKARADRRRDQAEAESLRDEGYPPGPPRPPPSIQLTFVR